MKCLKPNANGELVWYWTDWHRWLAGHWRFFGT